MSLLNAFAAFAVLLAQASEPRVQEVDLMAPAARQEPPSAEQAPTTQPESARQAEQAESSPPVPLRSEARTSHSRIAAFWFVLPGGAS